MPTWGGRIPEYQIWQIVAYVRSLNKQEPKSATPARTDTIRAESRHHHTTRVNGVTKMKRLRSHVVGCLLLTRLRRPSAIRSSIPRDASPARSQTLWWFFFWLLLGAIFVIVMAVLLLALTRRHRGIEQEPLERTHAPSAATEQQADADRRGAPRSSPC